MTAPQAAATASPPTSGRPVRADLICAGDVIRTLGDRAAVVMAPEYLDGNVRLPYTECRSGKNGSVSFAADESVTLLRSAGSRAA